MHEDYSWNTRWGGADAVQVHIMLGRDHHSTGPTRAIRDRHWHELTWESPAGCHHCSLTRQLSGSTIMDDDAGHTERG